jgi:CRP-like cAMP-binding protein
MQQEVLQALRNSRLAQGMTESQLSELVASSQAQLKEYARGEVIFRDGDVPQRLYILINGSVRILKDTVSGRQILITEITEPGDMFGEIYLFVSRQTYDMYAEVLKPAKVLTVSNAMFSLRQGGTTHISSVLQQNMLKIFASKAYFMNNKLKVLASGSLRGKIVRYLFQQPAVDGIIHLAGSREDLAAYLAATRPSLSRELGAMQAEKILEVDGHEVRVLDTEKFESYL